MKDIIISVKRSVFRSDDPEKDMANSIYKKLRPEILERDNHTCQFCGFRADKFQEVHHIDDDHSNNDPSNLITACALCHANHHIGFSGIKGRGTLIYINPEWKFTQAAINNIVRLLWVSAGSDNKDIALMCSNVLARLQRCKLIAKEAIGTHELSVVSDFLLQLDDPSYAKRGNVLSGVYVLPLEDGFKQYVDYWKTIKSLNLNSVQDIAEQRLRQWSNSDGNILELCNALNIEIY